jgi:hypothetical protein
MRLFVIVLASLSAIVGVASMAQGARDHGRVECRSLMQHPQYGIVLNACKSVARGDVSSFEAIAATRASASTVSKFADRCGQRKCSSSDVNELASAADRASCFECKAEIYRACSTVMNGASGLKKISTGSGADWQTYDPSEEYSTCEGTGWFTIIAGREGLFPEGGQPAWARQRDQKVPRIGEEMEFRAPAQVYKSEIPCLLDGRLSGCAKSTISPGRYLVQNITHFHGSQSGAEIWQFCLRESR